MLLKSILIWISIIPLAIVNGGLRQRILDPLFGEKFANPISGLILCILIFIISLIFIPRLGKGNTRIYLIMGIIWVLLTIIFETILGLIMGNTFKEIINAYNITTGNLWLIVVVFMGIVPFLVAKIKHLN